MHLPALKHLIGAYYHQDWDLDYDSDEETIQAFATEAGELADQLPCEIAKVLLATPCDDNVESLLAGLGCEVDPSPSSRGSQRAWLAELASYARSH